MFRLSGKELQRRRASKLIQSTEEIFEDLGFDNFVEPGFKVEMSTAFDEVFELYAKIFNPEGGGEKVFAFDAHRLIKSLCRVWADLYGTVANYQEEVFRDKALLEKESKKPFDGEEGRVKILRANLMFAASICVQYRIP